MSRFDLSLALSMRANYEGTVNVRVTPSSVCLNGNVQVIATNILASRGVIHVNVSWLMQRVSCVVSSYGTDVLTALVRYSSFALYRMASSRNHHSTLLEKSICDAHFGSGTASR